MKEFVKYMTTGQVAKYIYDNVGPQCRNIDGKVEINNQPVTKAMIFDIYNQMKKRGLPIVISRIEDVLDPRWFDYRGPFQRFTDGWLAGEKYTLLYNHDNRFGLFKVHRSPRNEFCVRIIEGEDIITEHFHHKSAAIEFFNNQAGTDLTFEQFNQYKQI